MQLFKLLEKGPGNLFGKPWLRSSHWIGQVVEIPPFGKYLELDWVVRPRPLHLENLIAATTTTTTIQLHDNLKK